MPSRCLRSLSSTSVIVGAALGAALGAAWSCAVPSTLGLPCLANEHCDPGQHCGPDGTCVDGLPPMPGSTSSPSDTDEDPGSSSGSGSTSGLDTTQGPVDTGSSSGTTEAITATGGSSTGDACGQALGTCDALDLLFVVDNSGSMAEDNNVLIPALASVQGLLIGHLEGMCSYHIGLTTTEPAPSFQPSRCQVRGALSRAGVLCEDPWGDPDHPPWVSETDDINTLGCLFGVGEHEDDDEKQIETALAAVGPELGAAGACNEGFVREGVPLVIVLVTDEDDDDDSADPAEAPDRTGSAGSPDTWWDELTAIKDPSEMALVVIAATTGACTWTPQPGSTDGTGAEYAQNILDFAAYFLGAGHGDHFRPVDLCQPDELVSQIAVVENILTAVCEDATG